MAVLECGFDLARNPGLSNNTEYGAGEFPLPIRPSARSTGQSTSKMPSMTRAKQTGEAYPDLSTMKRELERISGRGTMRTSTGIKRSLRGIRQNWRGIKRSSKRTKRGGNWIC